MRTLGKYQVIEKIGVGGFGEVFKGYDPLIKRHVAIKTCETEDEEMRGRFFREAEIAGNLHHRNITTVYDFGVEDGLPYLIQEYLSGEDLDDKIKRRDYLPYPEKLYYLLQIARGLAYAHAQGVIHRDIKPANIRVLEDGTTKIMDFGIAKLAQQESGLTQTGMTVGTAAYLAPEQIRGETIVRATDVFSFGVLAYELLTYQRPFRGDQISAVLYRTLHEEPTPIAELWPEAPTPLVQLIDRCLSKAPQDRFGDGTMLVRELEAIQQASAAGRAVVSDLPQLPSLPAAAKTPDFRRRSAAHPVDPATEGFPLADAAQDPGDSTAARRGLDELELTSYTPPPQRAPVASYEGPKASRPATAPIATSGGKRAILAAALISVALLAAALGWWLGRESPPAEDERAAVAVGGGVGETVEIEPREATSTPPVITEDAPQDLRSATAAPPPVVVPPTEPASSPPLGATRESAPGAATGPASEAAERPPPPTPRYGELTVRAGLGKPQGVVLVDGQRLGSTPLRSHRITAGDHRLEIQPLSGDGQAIEQSLRVEPGREAVVTFDLGRGTARIAQKRAG